MGSSSATSRSGMSHRKLSAFATVLEYGMPLPLRPRKFQKTHKWFVIIQGPFDRSDHVARNVSTDAPKRIITEMRRACDLMPLDDSVLAEFVVVSQPKPTPFQRSAENGKIKKNAVASNNVAASDQPNLNGKKQSVNKLKSSKKPYDKNGKSEEFADQPASKHSKDSSNGVEKNSSNGTHKSGKASSNAVKSNGVMQPSQSLEESPDSSSNLGHNVKHQNGAVLSVSSEPERDTARCRKKENMVVEDQDIRVHRR